MAVVLQIMLRRSESNFRSATNPYIDAILVDETAATVEEMPGHLRKFGLIVKPSELSGGTVLGAQIGERQN